MTPRSSAHHHSDEGLACRSSLSPQLKLSCGTKTAVRTGRPAFNFPAKVCSYWAARRMSESLTWSLPLPVKLYRATYSSRDASSSSSFSVCMSARGCFHAPAVWFPVRNKLNLFTRQHGASVSKDKLCNLLLWNERQKHQHNTSTGVERLPVLTSD